MTQDPYVEFKAKQRDSWKHFAPLEAVTVPEAAKLVRYAGVKPGQEVLDVATGTGVVALTARRLGARVQGLDLTPELLARAKENAGIAGFDDVTWREGDAENLPYRDGQFDVVLSQFGHMFAPRPEVATKEMLRVLKPGGTIAFSTWPPDLMIGRMFALVGKHIPPPPGVAPTGQWGNPEIVRQRLGNAVRDVSFHYGEMRFPTLSPAHYRSNMELTSGPVIKLVQSFQSDPAKLSAFRHELEAVIAPFFADNCVSQHYLMTRAVKV